MSVSSKYEVLNMMSISLAETATKSSPFLQDLTCQQGCTYQKPNSKSKSFKQTRKKLARVLVVEDNLIIQRLIQMEMANYDLTFALTGEQGVDAFSESFDCVILDIGLPGMDGIEVCQKLRELDRKVPILFYSTNDSVDVVNKCTEVGGSGFLSKPQPIGKLSEYVEMFNKKAH